MLLVKDLHAYYGRAHILHGVSLEASAGEVVALLGRNGAGKSTVMKSIMGLVPAAAGEVTFDGKRIERLGAERFDGEDERAFLILSMSRRDRCDDRGDGESHSSRKLPNHELLPKQRLCLVVLGTRRTAKRLSGVH